MITETYGSLLFSAIFSASPLVALHSGAILPLWKTRGLSDIQVVSTFTDKSVAGICRRSIISYIKI